MITHVLHCPHCHGTDIVRHGKTPQGKQRYRCRETACHGGTFLLDYSYPGQSPHIKEQRLLLDSRVVDVPRSSHPTFVAFSFWKPFFFHGLQNT
jgi:hypothetical protein